MSFYDQASLQDILAAGGQPSMSMGQAVAGIPPSGYSNMAAQDPGFVDRVTARMQALINDPRQNQLPDQAYGRASSFERGNQGIPDDETSAWDIAKAVIKTPFALLNAGRDALQDTLGVGGAQYRQRQRDELQALQNLPQAQRQILGIDNISGISTPSMQAGESSGTAGAPSSLGSNAGSTMKGYVEWVNNLGRDRDLQTMNQVRATIKAQYAAGKLTAQQMEILNDALIGYRTAADTNRINAVTEGQLRENAWIDPQNRATLGVKQSQIGANNASAYDSTMGGNLKAAQQRTVDESRPYIVEGERAKNVDQYTKTFYAAQEGDDKHAAAQQELDQKNRLFEDVTYPSGLDAQTYARREDVRKERGYSVWEELQRDEARRKGQLNDANVLKAIAEADAATGGIQDDLARAESIRGTDPLRRGVLQSQIDLNAGKLGTEESQQGYLNARRDMTEEETRAIPKRLAGELAKIDAQMEGMAAQTRVRDMQARLYDIMADATMDRSQRQAAITDMNLEIGRLRGELLASQTSNADATTAARVKLVDGQLARLQSLTGVDQSQIDLNRSRAQLADGRYARSMAPRAQTQATGTSLMETDFNTRKEYDRRVNNEDQDPVAVARELGIPLKTNKGLIWDSQEPDFSALPNAIRERASTMVPSDSATSPVRPSGEAVNAAYRLLKGANPSGNEGDLIQRAQEVAAILPKLNRSSAAAFAKDAKANGLTQAETIALWKGSR